MTPPTPARSAVEAAAPSVPCPRCLAGSGSRCTTPAGAPRARHNERTILAARVIVAPAWAATSPSPSPAATSPRLVVPPMGRDPLGAPFRLVNAAGLLVTAEGLVLEENFTEPLDH